MKYAVIVLSLIASASAFAMGGPGHQQGNAPGYDGCKEGAQAVVTVPGQYQGRGQTSETAVFVCHNNQWVRVQ